MIKRGVLFGFVECDIKAPDHLRSHFEEITPIFKNMEVQLEDIGEFMEKFAHDHKINQASRCLLLLWGKDLPCHTTGQMVSRAQSRHHQNLQSC